MFSCRNNLIISCIPCLSNGACFFKKLLLGTNSIRHWPHFQPLSLSSNVLKGPVLEDLCMLEILVYLDLGSNRLSGEIPSTIFCNMSLKYTDLSNNTLSGEIPSTNQCELKELRFLLLWSNRLIGRTPSGLSNSTKLEWLDLESYLLSGELPGEMVRRMPYLQFLYLSYNDFVSHDDNSNFHPFFAALANSSNLQELDLAGNNIGGNLPRVIGKVSKKLVQIHLDDNLIHGPIPLQISNLVNLTLLNLSINLLNGSIPSQLGKIGKLERLYMSNNSLSGSIPSNIGNIPHLGMLDLSKNRLSGADLSGSFKRECQVLKKARHPNMIKIITICSKPDFKGLVLPLMSNGSLERHSHSLRLAKVVSIRTDVAEGVAYLHHHSPVRVVHSKSK